VCRPIDDTDRWREDWDRAARDLDPGFERRKRARQDKAAQRTNDRRRRLVEEAERARRKDDPTVN
jgi:hypothetical protein